MTAGDTMARASRQGAYRHGSLLLSLPLFLMLALVGCRGEAPEPLVEVRDSLGIRIVENRRVAETELARWSTCDSALVQIGVLEGDPRYQLFRVAGSVRLREGAIVVANAGTHELRWYDAEGTYLRSAGGEGGGPGEFTELDGIARLGEDSIIAYDSESLRVSVFTRDGAFVRSARLEGPRGFLEGAFADGSLFISVNTPGSGGLVEGLTRWRAVTYRYAGTGALLDSLGSFPGIEWFTEVRRSGEQIAGIRSQTPPFGRGTFFAVSDSLFYVGAQDTYEIGVYDLKGALAVIVRKQHVSRPVTAADRRAYRDDVLAELSDTGARREAERELEGLPFPESMPAYGKILADAEGNLWVAEYRGPGDDQPRWTVFDSEHRALATAGTPPRLTIHQIGSDYVLGRWRDEQGVEYVRLYELRKR